MNWHSYISLILSIAAILYGFCVASYFRKEFLHLRGEVCRLRWELDSKTTVKLGVYGWPREFERTTEVSVATLMARVVHDLGYTWVNGSPGFVTVTRKDDDKLPTSKG